MPFSEAVRICLRNYATFSGRAQRSEFWWFYLFVGLVVTVPSLVGAVLLATGAALSAVPTSSGDSPGTGSGIGALGIVGIAIIVLAILVSLALILPLLAAGSRRLRDGGHSPWLLLLYPISPVNIILIVLWALPGSSAGDPLESARAVSSS